MPYLTTNRTYLPKGRNLTFQLIKSTASPIFLPLHPTRSISTQARPIGEVLFTPYQESKLHTQNSQTPSRPLPNT